MQVEARNSDVLIFIDVLKKIVLVAHHVTLSIN